MNTARLAPFPSPLISILQNAATAWKQRDYQQSIDLLEKASRLAPDDPRILFDLARCYGLCYDYEAAEQCFEKGIRATGSRPEALLEAGRRCLVFSRMEMAG